METDNGPSGAGGESHNLTLVKWDDGAPER